MRKISDLKLKIGKETVIFRTIIYFVCVKAVKECGEEQVQFASAYRMQKCL